MKLLLRGSSSKASSRLYCHWEGLNSPDALIFTHTIKQISLIEPNCGGATEFTTKVRHVGPGFVLGRVGSRYVLRDLVLILMQVSKKSLPK